MSFFSNLFGRKTDTESTESGGQQTGVSSDDGGGGSTSTTGSTDQGQQQGGEGNTSTAPAGAVAGDGNVQGSTLQNQDGQVTNAPATQQTTVVTTDTSQQQGGEGNTSTAPEGAVEGDGNVQGATLQNQDGEVTNAPVYLADWQNGVSFGDAIQTGEHSIAEYMADYNKYAAANGQEPLDIFTMMNAMQGRDVNKSVQQNVADEKKRIRQERWQQVGNVLAHLGNFVGTLVGAPSQTIESGTELTKRQQILRDKTMQERAAYNQNLLAQIWKDRADARAAEKNNADIGLIRQRIEALQNDDARKTAKNDADIALAGARQQQAEEGAKLNNERAETERQSRDAKIANIKSQTNAHNAAAAASRARANASNVAAYGNKYKANRYKIWAENKRKYPNEFRDFMSQNNIHSWDRKNWSSELIDQFNAWVADKVAAAAAGGAGGSGNAGGSGGAADLLD